MQVYGHYSLFHGAGLTTIMSKQHFIYIFFIYCIYFSIYFILNAVHGPVIVEYLQFIIYSVIVLSLCVMACGCTQPCLFIVFILNSAFVIFLITSHRT